MKFGINIPNFGDYWHPKTLVELAQLAEESGWDGFFVWDHIYGSSEWSVPVGDRQTSIGSAPYADPYIALAAIATNTKRIHIGTMVTPLARRRPWKLARELVSLDHLSNGRLILGIGLGGTHIEFEAFGENSDPRARATKLDESLDILMGLWSGEPFTYVGENYSLRDVTFKPKPLQAPRIPIWAACFWPNKKPLRRAAQLDGVVPITEDWTKKVTPNDVMQIRTYISEHRSCTAPYDIVIGGETPADKANGREIIQPYAEAGASWWSENINSWRGPPDEMKEKISHGPPES
ncbi:MAG: LLM class flavin-dependent oxidoreductase [Candidatus Bathyarchaeota archaeon]|nr:MAG: LLM class flavin-dependent oxidoreductase [Candidatus Bathyarchaeota archaeon]